LKPTIFSGPMVRAIRERRKSCTRRTTGLDAVNKLPFIWPPPDQLPDGSWVFAPLRDAITVRCPYGAPGSLLYVRETWKYADWTDDGVPFIRYQSDGEEVLRQPSAEWADRVTDIWADLSAPENYAIDGRAADRRWRSPRFMPRWASRLTLRVTEERVERVQEITEEGVTPGETTDGDESYALGFIDTWEDIHGPGAWDRNEWVWRVGFEVVEP